MSVVIVGTSDLPLFLEPIPLPLFLERVSAGFPSPAQDYLEKRLDLNELCIQHPAATFMVRVDGDSMIEVGIFQNDYLVVDRSVRPMNGDVVIASLYGELTVKELDLNGEIPRLVPRNQAYDPIDIPEESGAEIFGVVTSVVRNLQRPSKNK